MWVCEGEIQGEGEVRGRLRGGGRKRSRGRWVGGWVCVDAWVGECGDNTAIYLPHGVFTPLYASLTAF